MAKTPKLGCDCRTPVSDIVALLRIDERHVRRNIPADMLGSDRLGRESVPTVFALEFVDGWQEGQAREKRRQAAYRAYCAERGERRQEAITKAGQKAREEFMRLARLQPAVAGVNPIGGAVPHVASRARDRALSAQQDEAERFDGRHPEKSYVEWGATGGRDVR